MAKDQIAEHLRGMCGYNKQGEELVSNIPVALPVGFKRPTSLGEKMKALVQNELIQRELYAAGLETFEEADDLDCDEQDPLSNTPYEDCFEPERPGATAREQELRANFVADIRPDQKAKAKEVIERHRKKPEEPPKASV